MYFLFYLVTMLVVVLQRGFCSTSPVDPPTAPSSNRGNGVLTVTRGSPTTNFNHISSIDPVTLPSTTAPDAILTITPISGPLSTSSVTTTTYTVESGASRGAKSVARKSVDVPGAATWRSLWKRREEDHGSLNSPTSTSTHSEGDYRPQGDPFDTYPSAASSISKIVSPLLLASMLAWAALFVLSFAASAAAADAPTNCPHNTTQHRGGSDGGAGAAGGAAGAAAAGSGGHGGRRSAANCLKIPPTNLLLALSGFAVLITLLSHTVPLGRSKVTTALQDATKSPAASFLVGLLLGMAFVLSGAFYAAVSVLEAPGNWIRGRLLVSRRSSTGPERQQKSNVGPAAQERGNSPSRIVADRDGVYHGNSGSVRFAE